MNLLHSFHDRRRRFWAAGTAAVVIASITVGYVAAAPSSFVELDGNVVSATNTNQAGGPYDWANGGALTTTGGNYTRAGGGGLFNGGHFNGNTTPPTAPSITATANSDPSIAAAAFKVDPLSVDVTSCSSSGGDPTVYTGVGSEKNGDTLSTDTFGTGSVPNKDDLSNVYAVAHIDATHNEVFFGAERVVNNGDSHIDFEFLQNAVTIPDACSGSFSGHRAQGDFLMSVDFSNGGTFGDTIIYKWNCLAEGQTQPAVGTVCDPIAKTQFAKAHYQQTSSTAITISVNGTAAVPCGGWVCRNADGTPTTSINTNELMEGGINLDQLGFTGCISTFLPHTRSAQQFTATLKDFEIIPFNTCATPSVSTTIKNAAGDAVTTPQSIPVTLHDTATLSNTTGSAGGTITYKLYANNDCTSLIEDLTPTTNTVVNGVAPDSKPHTFSSAGTFYFYAEYSGDARNTGPVNSGCAAEPVTISPNTPAVSTTIKDAGGTAVTTAQTIPVTLHDTATITGATAHAGGTITYSLFNNSTCSTANNGLVADLTPTTNTVVDGVAPDSKTFTFNHAGTFYFYAVYSGDSDNTGPVNSGCAAEPVTINPNTPAVSTTIKNAAGTAVTSAQIIPVTLHDTATITGATAHAGGTITYSLFNNSTCSTANNGLVADLTPTTNTVVDGVAPDSKTYTFTNAGTFYFYAVYSGDSDNTGPVNSGCAAEPVTISPNTPAPQSQPAVQIRDHVSASGFTSDATGNVLVGIFTSSSCSAASRLSGNVDESFTIAQVTAAGGVDTQWVTVAAGTYYYKVSYAGDNNNTGFSSCTENVNIQSITGQS